MQELRSFYTVTPVHFVEQNRTILHKGKLYIKPLFATGHWVNYPFSYIDDLQSTYYHNIYITSNGKIYSSDVSSVYDKLYTLDFKELPPLPSKVTKMILVKDELIVLTEEGKLYMGDTLQPEQLHFVVKDIELYTYNSYVILGTRNELICKTAPTDLQIELLPITIKKVFWSAQDIICCTDAQDVYHELEIEDSGLKITSLSECGRVVDFYSYNLNNTSRLHIILNDKGDLYFAYRDGTVELVTKGICSIRNSHTGLALTAFNGDAYVYWGGILTQIPLNLNAKLVAYENIVDEADNLYAYDYDKITNVLRLLKLATRGIC